MLAAEGDIANHQTHQEQRQKHGQHERQNHRHSEQEVHPSREGCRASVTCVRHAPSEARFAHSTHLRRRWLGVHGSNREHIVKETHIWRQARTAEIYSNMVFTSRSPHCKYHRRPKGQCVYDKCLWIYLEIIHLAA